jgi:hypothetical protein
MPDLTASMLRPYGIHEPPWKIPFRKSNIDAMATQVAIRRDLHAGA